MTHEERLAKAIEFNKQFMASKKAAQIAIIDLIKADSLNEDEIEDLVEIYPKYEVGVAYETGDLFNQDGVLYEVIQSHTSQADWLPSSTPALYKAINPVGVVSDWIQPTGAHDAYNIGDRVMFEGSMYESLINANTWSPTGYPQGWKLVE